MRTDPCPDAKGPQAAPVVICAECNSECKAEDVINLGGLYCCSKCKPIFLQKLSEGCTNTPPSFLSVTYHSTRAAIWRCTLYTLFHSKRYVLVSGACILLLSICLPLPALSSSGEVNGIFRLIAATAVVALLNLLALTLAMLKLLPTAKTIRTCTSGLTPEGVSNITPDRRRLVPWRKITEIREHLGDIHVWFGLSGIFIPRHAFKDQDEAQRFASLAVELWRTKGSKCSEAVANYWRNT